MKLDTHLAFAWRFVFGVLLTLAPGLVVLFKWILFVAKRRDVRKEESDPWALLFNKAATEEGAEIRKTPEPTSIEFETDFENLMNEALADKERRLVLVLDNLDRIDSEDALSIWSTLQTFLQPANRFPQLWVIILYDLTGLKLLWSKRAAEQDEIASSFIEKSFHIQFEVPRPLISNWHEYLLMMLEKAFPVHYDSNKQRREEEFHKTYRVLSTYLGSTGRLPTPRELIVFVNQIGALHRQWQDQFPLSHMAYYVVLRRYVGSAIELTNGLLAGHIPERDYESLFAADVREHLAALLFNVDATTAKQLLLRGPITEALDSRDTKKLAEFQSLHEGFWEVLDNIAAMEWVGAQATIITNAAICLKESGLLNNGRSEARYVYNQLLKAFIRVQSWTPFDENVAKGIAALFDLIQNDTSKEEHITTILKALTLSLPVVANDADQTPAVESWTSAIQIVLGYLQSVELETAFVKGLIDPIALRLKSLGNLQPNELSALLQSLFELRAKVDAAELVLSLLATEGYILHHLTDALQNPTSAAWCIFIFLLYVPTAEIKSIVGNSALGLNLIRKLLSEENVDQMEEEIIRTTADRFADLLNRYGRLELPFRVVRTQKEAEHIEELLGEIVIYKEVRSKKTTEPFMVRCLKVLAEKGQLEHWITVERIMDEWFVLKRLRRGIPPHIALDKLIGNLMKNSDLISKVLDTNFDAVLAGLYNVMALQGAKDNTRFRDWLENGLRGISKEEWEAEMQGEGDLVWLIIDLASIDLCPSLPAYEDALVEQAKAVIGGWRPESNNTIIWNIQGKRLLEPLDHQSKQAVRARLMQAAENVLGEIAPPFFNLFGSEIANDEFLPSLDRYIRLFKRLLEKRNANGLEWTAEVLVRPAFQKTSQPILDFSSQVQQAILNDPIDEASPKIREIGKLLGILDENSTSAGKKPEVGMEVGFRYDANIIYPAQVIEVVPDDPMTVHLAAETPRGKEFFRRVRYDQSGKDPGTYHFKA